MKSKQATMEDVAREAGVSRATVSLALRNARTIKAETRERVQQAAEKLGYRPNPMVASLMENLRRGGRKGMHQNCVLAFIDTCTEQSPWQRKVLHRKYFNGAKRRAEELGFQLMPFNVNDPGMRSKRLSDILYARGIPGVLMAPRAAPVEAMEVDWSHFAVASIGHTSGPEFHMAAHHTFQNMRTALNVLTRQNYLRIGFCLSEELDARVNYGWTSAFLRLQLDFIRKNRVPLCLFPQKQFHSVFRKWVRGFEPDVIISAYGYPMFEMLEELGRPVPEQTGFVTLSQHPEHDDYSGMDECAEGIGALGMDIVIDQLYRNERGLPEHPKVVMHAGRWRQGWTTRASAAAE